MNPAAAEFSAKPPFSAVERRANPRRQTALLAIVACALGLALGGCALTGGGRAADLAASAAAPAEPTSATVTAVRFPSLALGRDAEYLAIHPAKFQPGRRYPTLYLLHGAWGDRTDWLKRAPLLEAMNRRDLIVILPDGGQFGWYVDSPTSPCSNYETFITRDLIADVDARFPTLRGRAARGIAGLSMGGHGALSLAANHPRLFSSASSMSGILRLEAHPGKWKLNEVLGDPVSNADFWRAHSVYQLVDRFAEADIALRFDTGREDATGAVDDNRRVSERLANRRILHTYKEFPGKHSWAYWSARLPEHLDFHEANFAARARGETPPTGQRFATKQDLRYSTMTLEFERDTEARRARPDAPRPIVFLGSSSIQIGGRRRLGPPGISVYRGIAGDGMGVRGQGGLHRLYCSALDLNPRAVFIQNGRNDLASTARTGRPAIEEIVAVYAEVIARLRKGAPDAHVFIVACPPTSQKYDAMAPLIPQYNARLRELAAAGDERVHFLDCFTPFANAENRLRPEFTSDGLHLNVAAYDIYRALVEEALTGVGLGDTLSPPDDAGEQPALAPLRRGGNPATAGAPPQ